MNKDDLFIRMSQLISKIHDLETSLSSRVSDEEVTTLQFDILQILFFSGSKNLSGLSRCMNINLPNCSREVKKLTNLGLLKKSGSPDDKRKTELSLTEKGDKKVALSLEQMKQEFFNRNKEWDEKRIKRCIESIDILEKEIFNTK